jgi:hypothetical protein
MNLQGAGSGALPRAHLQPAVDGEILVRHIIGLIGGKLLRKPGNLPRLAALSPRDVRADLRRSSGSATLCCSVKDVSIRPGAMLITLIRQFLTQQSASGHRPHISASRPCWRPAS